MHLETGLTCDPWLLVSRMPNFRLTDGSIWTLIDVSQEERSTCIAQNQVGERLLKKFREHRERRSRLRQVSSLMTIIHGKIADRQTLGGGFREMDFVADHDPALRAANCVVSLSERLQLRMLGNEYGYCVGESFVENPLLRWYRVLEVMPMDHKKVRAMSRILKVGRWELKSRNIDIDLISWGKQLTVDKDSDVVGWLLLTKVGKKHVCLVCQEIQQ